MTHSTRSGGMRASHWTAWRAAVALVLGAAACTDPTVAPKSNVTGANFFGDPSSYEQFVAKIYAGLAVGGQNGGAGSTAPAADRSGEHPSSLHSQSNIVLRHPPAKNTA